MFYSSGDGRPGGAGDASRCAIVRASGTTKRSAAGRAAGATHHEGGQQMSENAGQAVVAGVRDLLPVLRERAQEAEDARVVPAESVKALEETGFFRLLQPAAYDGLEADPVTFLSEVRLIASACGSTGWVASVLGVHAWQLAL